MKLKDIIKINKADAERIISISVIITLLVVIVAQTQIYHTETKIINNTFEKNNLPHPSFNVSTGFFEYKSNSSIFVGYTTYNDMNTNKLVIMEFKNASVVNLSGRMVYTAENNEMITITEIPIKRRFTY